MTVAIRHLVGRWHDGGDDALRSLDIVDGNAGAWGLGLAAEEGKTRAEGGTAAREFFTHTNTAYLRGGRAVA